MIQRGGQVVLRVLENVRQATILPIIETFIAPGTLVNTDEYNIYGRLAEWGYEHKSVCHAIGEYARDEDGDGFHEVHVNTMEGLGSLLRSWLRPHRDKHSLKHGQNLFVELTNAALSLLNLMKMPNESVLEVTEDVQHDPRKTLHLRGFD